MKTIDISKLNKESFRQTLLEESERADIVFKLYNNGLLHGDPKGKEWYQKMCDETLRKKSFCKSLIDNLDELTFLEVSDEEIMFLKEIVKSQLQYSESRLKDYQNGLLERIVKDSEQLPEAINKLTVFENNIINLCKQIEQIINE